MSALFALWLTVHAAAPSPNSIALVELSPPGQSATEAMHAARAQLEGEGRAVLSGPAAAALSEPSGQNREGDALKFAEGAMAAARADYQSFRPEMGLERLRPARRRLAEVAPSDEVTKTTADLELLFGVLAAEAGARDEAIDAFRAVQVLSPERRSLDEAQYRPKVVALYRTAQQRGAAALSVQVSPTDALVFVDGKPAAPGRSQLDLPVGPHYVFVQAPGRASRGERISLDASGSMLRWELLPLEGPEAMKSVRAELRGRPDPLNEHGLLEVLRADASVQTLVLFRSTEDGVVDAVYPSTSPTWQAWRGRIDLGPPSTTAAAPLRELEPPPIVKAAPASHWYQHGWVVAAAVAVAVVGAGAAAAYVATRPPSTSYSFTTWCLNGTCAP